MGDLFGTNGVRGRINREITVDVVLRLSKAIGTVLGPGKIAISRDAREGGEMFLDAVISGLLSTGCSVIDIGPGPIPGLQFTVPRLGVDGGVMVTASHNPPEFSGIKVIGADGIEISRAKEEEIEAAYFNEEFTVAEWNEIKSVSREDDAIRYYVDAIKSHVNVDAIEKANLKVIVDGANSVGSLVTPLLLRELGCHVVSLNSQLDGNFPGRDPEPIPKNLSSLSHAVKATKANLGVAHDGDADRATFVDEDGTILWGDQSFAIVAKRVLSKHDGATLVTPVSSGRLIEDVAKEAGAQIEWTRVGSIIVSHRLKDLGAELGGEENGGIFYPPHQPVRDGAMTAAQIIEIMATEGKSLSELADELPTYHSSKTKVPVPEEKKDSILGELLEMTEGMARITLDGVKLQFEDGWILMRPSGTEPLWRCFAESKTRERAEELSARGVELIRTAIERS